MPGPGAPLRSEVLVGRGRALRQPGRDERPQVREAPVQWAAAPKGQLIPSLRAREPHPHRTGAPQLVHARAVRDPCPGGFASLDTERYIGAWGGRPAVTPTEFATTSAHWPWWCDEEASLSSTGSDRCEEGERKVHEHVSHSTPSQSVGRPQNRSMSMTWRGSRRGWQKNMARTSNLARTVSPPGKQCNTLQWQARGSNDIARQWHRQIPKTHCALGQHSAMTHDGNTGRTRPRMAKPMCQGQHDTDMATLDGQQSSAGLAIARQTKTKKTWQTQGKIFAMIWRLNCKDLTGMIATATTHLFTKHHRCL